MVQPLRTRAGSVPRASLAGENCYSVRCSSKGEVAGGGAVQALALPRRADGLQVSSRQLVFAAFLGSNMQRGGFAVRQLPVLP